MNKVVSYCGAEQTTRKVLSMDLNTIANIATIIGATSILVTLIFIIIELQKNLTQFRLIREINLRDVQNQFYMHWSEPQNASLVIKGRKNFTDLSEEEKFRFELYVEMRIRIMAFGLNVLKTKENWQELYRRVGQFMSDPGTNDCYEVISQKQGIPTRIVNLVEKGRAYYKA